MRVNWILLGEVNSKDVISDYYCNETGLNVIGRLPVLFIILLYEDLKPIISPTKAFSTSKLKVNVFSSLTPCKHPVKLTIGTITCGTISINKLD